MSRGMVNIKFESSENMVKINKSQASYIRQHMKQKDFENPVTRTMRQKSKRHNYYACEENSIIELLNDYNSQINVLFTYGTVD